MGSALGRRRNAGALALSLICTAQQAVRWGELSGGPPVAGMIMRRRARWAAFLLSRSRGAALGEPGHGFRNEADLRGPTSRLEIAAHSEQPVRHAVVGRDGQTSAESARWDMRSASRLRERTDGLVWLHGCGTNRRVDRLARPGAVCC